jgi:drug/metabolite transporter (DMT)-like permease
MALVVGACCIGLAPVFPKLAVDTERLLPGGGLGMIATAFWRTALAAPFFWWLHLRFPVPSPPHAAPRAKWLWLPGVAFAADLAAWHKAFEYTTLANATLLANLASILVAIVGYLWLRERLSWMFAVGAAVALSGTSVLLGVDLRQGPDPVIGDGLGLVTACCYAAYLLLVKVLRRDFSVPRIMSYASSVSAAGLLAVAALSGERLVPQTWPAWLSVIALAFVSHVGGQGLIAYAMAHLPASFATLSLLIQPVVTATVSWLLFAQVLTPVQIGGGVLVLAGLVMARRGSLSE